MLPLSSDPATLRAIARQLQKQAQEMLDQADQAERIEQARAAGKASRQRLSAAAEIAAAYMIAGRTPDQAAHMAQKITGQDASRIAAAMPLALVKMATSDRRQRNAKMLAQAETKTHANIAAGMGLHQKSVARIVAQLKRTVRP